MKTKIFLLLLLGIISTSCEQKDISLFKDGSEIYFEKFYMNAVSPGREQADSTVVSFFFYPDNTQTVEIPLVVNLSGRALTTDLSFGLKVIETGTTARVEEYTIAPHYTFRCRPIPEGSESIKDTLLLTMHYSDRLAAMPEGIRLVVELVPNEQVGVGQVERRRAVVILTTTAKKPVWWTKDVENNLLGVYSEKKYKLFLNEIDKEAQMDADLIANRQDLAIKLVMQFKEWLTKQVPVILEDDGSPMEVNV